MERVFWKKKILNEPGGQKLDRKIPVAVGEACMATF